MNRLKILVGKALASLIDEGVIQNQLRIKGNIAPMLKLRISQSLKQELQNLKKQSWFSINPFTPNEARMEPLRQLYKEFCLDPDLQKKIPGGKGEPSDVDIALLLFSLDSKHPLLTNDKEIYSFADELKNKEFCEMVRGFRHVAVK